MLKTVVKQIRHATVLVRHALRDVGRPRRSPRWNKVKAMHLAMEPTCAACGGEVRLQVHHIKPYHLQPELELDLSNLVTLCMGPNECHLHVGHGDDFKAYNPDVLYDAHDVLAARQKGDQGRVGILLRYAREKRRYAVLVRPGTPPGPIRILH